jgi:exopolyphosphatase / guanosine-5'-triphosphate,3'-diphosphate pyrophosphatase
VRVGVIDIGTNSTRLLVAEVDGGGVTQLDRRSVVTRLGTGVDAGGRLSAGAMARVLAVLDDYVASIESHGCEATTAVLTSAVRDAANGAAFTDRVRTRYGLDARTITGEEEARLTFLGATHGAPRSATRSTVVIDVGGGSTEVVVGRDGRVSFHASTQAGVVRQAERHIRHDPPAANEMRALAEEVRALVGDAVPRSVRREVESGIAVAGTPTSLAAIEHGIEPYDPRRVHGSALTRAACERRLEQLAALPLERRRGVAGLHPDRAPTIVPGALILLEVMGLFQLEAVEVSEDDLLRGAALRLGAGVLPGGRSRARSAPPDRTGSAH